MLTGRSARDGRSGLGLCRSLLLTLRFGGGGVEERDREIFGDGDQAALDQVQKLVQTLGEDFPDHEAAERLAYRRKRSGRITAAAQPVARSELSQEPARLADAKQHGAREVRI